MAREATQREYDLACQTDGTLPPDAAYVSGDVPLSRMAALVTAAYDLNNETLAMRGYFCTTGSEFSKRLVEEVDRIAGWVTDEGRFLKRLYIRLGTGCGYDLVIEAEGDKLYTARRIQGRLECDANKAAFGPS